MSIIEIGGFAGGILSVLALITKIVNLITAIQSLIHRLDILQQDMAVNKENQRNMQHQLDDHAVRVQSLETTTQVMQADVHSTRTTLKELVESVFG